MENITEVRALFEARKKEGIPTPPGEFDHRDLERVADDKYVSRVLDHCENDARAAAKMLWEIMVWRNKVDVNEIRNVVDMDCLKAGMFFPHGRDVDGSLLFIVRGKLYNTGQKNVDELKKVIVYWLERMEKEEDGRPISLFLDFDKCGVSHLDVEIVNFMSVLLKYYYPKFVNYSLIYQMPWIKSPSFEVIKGLFPAEALERFRFVDKDSLKEFVKDDQALVSWGGTDEYHFEFVPESSQDI